MRFSETLTLILPRKPKQPDPVESLLARYHDDAPPVLGIVPRHVPDASAMPDSARLFPSLYHLLSREAILEVLEHTDSTSQRLRRLPAHEVVWLVIAQSWFAERSIPKVWRHLHPSPDRPEPVDSAFTQARQRLAARCLQRLFHRTCRPLSVSDGLGVFHNGWLLVALDGSVFEAPDTPVNRKTLGAASNQHGAVPSRSCV